MDEELEVDAVHRLIQEAASAAPRLTPTDLRRVLVHVAQAGFDAAAREQVRGSLAGSEWRGMILKGSDRLPPAERHYLRHVRKLREWPVGTSLEEYIDSVRGVVLDPRSGAFTSRYQGALQLGIIRRSGDLRGPAGFSWVLVEYRLQTGHWTTAYQPDDSEAALAIQRREGLRWLRRARPTLE